MPNYCGTGNVLQYRIAHIYGFRSIVGNFHYSTNFLETFIFMNLMVVNEYIRLPQISNTVNIELNVSQRVCGVYQKLLYLYEY